MDQIQVEGFADQEVLLRALVTFVSQKIDRSELLVKGMIRQSIAEWATRNKSSLKEIKYKDENERLEVVSEIIDIFLLKIRHIETNSFRRKEIKNDALQIYNYWKKTRRSDPSEQLITDMENL